MLLIPRQREKVTGDRQVTLPRTRNPRRSPVILELAWRDIQLFIHHRGKHDHPEGVIRTDLPKMRLFEPNGSRVFRSGRYGGDGVFRGYFSGG